jgi:hypothetical protein
MLILVAMRGLLIIADCGAEGEHALLRMRQEGPEAYRQDGRYENCFFLIITMDETDLFLG